MFSKFPGRKRKGLTGAFWAVTRHRAAGQATVKHTKSETSPQLNGKVKLVTPLGVTALQEAEMEKWRNQGLWNDIHGRSI